MNTKPTGVTSESKVFMILVNTGMLMDINDFTEGVEPSDTNMATLCTATLIDSLQIKPTVHLSIIFSQKKERNYFESKIS